MARKKITAPVATVAAATTEDLLTMNTIESAPNVSRNFPVILEPVTDAALDALLDDVEVIKPEIIAESEDRSTVAPEGWDESATGETDIEVKGEDEPTLSELEAAVTLIEAREGAVQDGEAETPVPEIEAGELSFDEIVGLISKEDSLAMARDVGREMDVRVEFEREKSLRTGKDNIFKNCASARSKMISPAVAKTLLAVDVDPSFINRSLAEGSRYGVYALKKLADIAEGAAGQGSTNAINLAIMKSMFALKRLGSTFSMELAKASCSRNYRVDSPYVKHLVRHTVAVETVSTQSSSTMQALETLGVVKNVGSRKAAVYEVVNTPLARKLEEVLMAA